MQEILIWDDVKLKVSSHAVSVEQKKNTTWNLKYFSSFLPSKKEALIRTAQFLIDRKINDCQSLEELAQLTKLVVEKLDQIEQVAPSSD